MCTVLIVDDDPNVREFLGLLIADTGYTTFSASNGQKPSSRSTCVRRKWCCSIWICP
jgi:CheY-like chemotaxis protein